MMLELERLGVDIDVRSLLQMVAPDLSALKAMDDGDEVFSSIVEEQMQKIRPLLSESSIQAAASRRAREKGMQADREEHMRKSMEADRIRQEKAAEDLGRAENRWNCRERAQQEVARGELARAERFRAQCLTPASLALKDNQLCIGHPDGAYLRADLRGEMIRPAETGALRSETRTPATGRMLSDARHLPGSDAEHLRSWFLQQGVAGQKLQEILRVCASEYIQSPADLRDLQEVGELARIFPQRVLLLCVEKATRADGRGPLVKTEGSKFAAFVPAVGGPGTMGDGWANNDSEARSDATMCMGALRVLDPRAEGQRDEAQRQCELLVTQFPDLMPGVTSAPQSLNYGLTQLNDQGLRAIRSHSLTPYDEKTSTVCRTRAGDVLQMGYGNCTVSLDIGDRDAQGLVKPLVRVVETMAQIQALCDDTVIRTNVLTKGVDNWVQACIPSYFTDIVVNPTGAQNAKGQLTGDPIKGMENRPLLGGIFQESTMGFANAESNASMTKNPQVLARSKFENNGTSIFMSKAQMDSGLELLAALHAQARAEMVALVRKELQHTYSDVTDLQLMAEPAIAVIDETWRLMPRLAKHATRWNNLWEASKKTVHPTACPFGQDGVMMTQMRQVDRVFQMTDMDARAIARCQTRRMAAMFMRLACLKRVVEYFDAYAGRMFDLSAVMRATKGGKVVRPPDAAIKAAVVPTLKKTPPTASGGAARRQSTAPSTDPVEPVRQDLQTPRGHSPTAASLSGSCLPVGGATPKPKSAKKTAATAAKDVTPWARGKKVSFVAPKSAATSAAVKEERNGLSSKADDAIEAAAKDVLGQVQAQPGVPMPRLDAVKVKLKTVLSDALKSKNLAISSFADLRAEARTRGAAGTDWSIPLLKKLMRDRISCLPSSMKKVVLVYNSRKRRLARPNKSASTSLPPNKRGRTASTQPSSTSKPTGSAVPARSESDEDGIPRFEDITEEADAASTKGSSALPSFDAAMRIRVVKAGAHSETVNERMEAINGMTVGDAMKHKVPFKEAGCSSKIAKMSWARILRDVSDGLIELETSVELDQCGEVLLPPGFNREDGSNPEPDFPPSALPPASAKKRLSPLCSQSVMLLPRAQVEEACATVLADPSKCRLGPDIGASDLASLSWADRRRFEDLTMSTSGRAWTVIVTVDDGIDGGFQKVPYTLDLLKADLKRRIFKVAKLDAAAATKPRVSFNFGGGKGLFAPPATSGGGGTMSGKVVSPIIGSCCGIVVDSIEAQMAGDALPFDEVATQVVSQMLATIDCKDWKTGVSQICLRSTEYSKQMECEHSFVVGLQQAETRLGAHPMCGKEFDPESDLWAMVLSRVESLFTPIAIQAWSCFAENQALLQLSFVFGEEGGCVDEVVAVADATVMIGIVKLLMGTLIGRQMIVMPVYINGAGCDPHRAILLVGSVEVVYYDPSGAEYREHHCLRGAFVMAFLQEHFGSCPSMSFAGAAGQDNACPQGAPDACDFNCNALCMLLVAAACSGGVWTRLSS
jgi:hypothetical protein